MDTGKNLVLISLDISVAAVLEIDLVVLSYLQENVPAAFCAL